MFKGNKVVTRIPDDKAVEKEPPKSFHSKLNSLIMVMFKGNKVVTRIPDDKA